MPQGIGWVALQVCREGQAQNNTEVRVIHTALPFLVGVITRDEYCWYQCTVWVAEMEGSHVDAVQLAINHEILLNRIDKEVTNSGFEVGARGSLYSGDCLIRCRIMTSSFVDVFQGTVVEAAVASIFHMQENDL